MRVIFHIFLLTIPVLAVAQTDHLSFHSEFEKSCFQKLESNTLQPEDKLALFFALDPKITQEAFNERILELHSFGNREQLHKRPQRIYRKIQQEFLDEFVQTCDITDLIEDKRFNCVSGSAIMAYFLESNGFNYSIEELPHHVFLTAKHGKQGFIMETTDKLGLLKDTEQNRLVYHKDTIDKSLIFEQIGYNDNSDQKTLVVRGSVTMTQLAGLAYYNKAIASMNTGDFESAVVLLQKSHRLYASERIEKALRYSVSKVLNYPHLSRDEKKPYFQLMVYFSQKMSLNDNY